MKIKSLRKSFDNRTLFENLSLEIDTGILTLKGKSGCGKSTLISIIIGKEKPDDGDIIFDVNEKNISYCGQENLIPPSYSLYSFCKFLKLLNNIQYKELIKEFSFEKNERVELRNLSGGERQKAEIIVALLKKSDIYIFDEPLSALDKKSKEIVVKKIEELSKTKLVILVNHDSSVVISYSVMVDFDDGVKVISNFENKIKRHEEINENISINSFDLILKTFFKENKLFNIVHFILLSFSLFFFSLFSCFNSNLDYRNSNLLSLKNDPISIHDIRLDVSSNNQTEESLKFIDEGNSIFKIRVGMKQLFICDFLNEDKFEYVSNNDEFVQLFDSKLISLDGDEFEISKFDSEIDYEPIKCVIDNYSSDTYLLTSKKMLKEMIINNLNNYKIAGESIAFSENICSEVGLSKYLNYDIKIIEGNHLVSIPSIKDGELIHLDFNDKITFENKNIENSTDIIISYDLFKLFLLCNKGHDDNFYNLAFEKEKLMTLIENYTFIYAENVTANYIDSDQLKLIFLIFSIVLFVSLVIFYFLSFNGLSEYKNRIGQIYSNNRLDHQFKRDVILLALFSSFIPFIVITCLYPLNLYLCNLIPAILRRNSTGTGLYSKLPMNSYYENINSPLKFLNGDLYFLLNFIFSLVIFCVFFYLLISKKKKSR